MQMNLSNNYRITMNFLGLENEEDDYDPEFVAKIKNAEKEESKKIDLEKYGMILPSAI